MSIRNCVTLIGNVGQQPTLTTLPSGTQVIDFSLATNESYRNRDGERVQRTDWHRIKAYGKVSEVLGRYVNKGTQLAVTGTIRYNTWTDKEGQTRQVTDIILDEFTFLDSKEGGSSSNYGEASHEETELMVAEPAPTAAPKTSKRRGKKATATTKKGAKAKAGEMTSAEDLPF